MKDQQNAYKAAGVDIDEGNRLVNLIGPGIKKTNRSGVMSGIGGFGACFDLKSTGYKDPILVSSTDGVGTKLKIAIETQLYDTIGIDLVAMCVNDIIVQGAEPIFFLDYFACARLDADKAAEVINSISLGCIEAGCALIGGETAEMPGMYNQNDFDLAGFCVGIAERDQVITGKTISEGDLIIGLGSSGLHSNGYSLARKIVTDHNHLYSSPSPFAKDLLLGHALLLPTKIYVRSILKVIGSEFKIKGLAHITGGGLLENIPRMLPAGLGVVLDADTWECPPVVKWLVQTAKLSTKEALRTFNCGIGMVLACSPDEAQGITRLLEASNEKVFLIGTVSSLAGDNESSVTVKNMDILWDLKK